MRFPSWFRIGLCGLLGVASASGPAHAHDGHDEKARLPPRVPEGELHRPGTMPDRIVLTWTGDPAVSQAITWRTRTSVTNALAQLALATDSPQKSSREAAAITQQLDTDLGPASYHTVEFQGLEPDTLYAYRVGDSVNWSEWFQFRTARQEAAPFTFLYFGDAQNEIRTHWSRVVREAFRAAPRAAFTLHAGDLVNTAGRDAEWGEWFGAPAWVNAVVPVVPTPGNHEYFTPKGAPSEVRLWDARDRSNVVVSVVSTEKKDAAGKQTGTNLVVTAIDGRTGKAQVDLEGRILSVEGALPEITGYEAAAMVGTLLKGPPLNDRLAFPPRRELSAHWRPQFALPLNGPVGLEESAYFFDYQGVRIVSLNSNERQDVQAAWLRAVLADNPQRWTILTFHHPIFSPAGERDNPQLRKLWKPVIDQFRVDLVLSGHDHTYARSGDLGGRATVGITNVPTGYQQVYDAKIGTVYVVSVSGSKMYAQPHAHWALRRAEDIQLFQIITVDGDELRYEARTATGRLYDTFRLRKKSGQPNQLIEALPPENRRPPPSPTPAPAADPKPTTAPSAP